MKHGNDSKTSYLNHMCYRSRCIGQLTITQLIPKNSQSLNNAEVDLVLLVPD